jgi:hypothetical protein
MGSLSLSQLSRLTDPRIVQSTIPSVLPLLALLKYKKDTSPFACKFQCLIYIGEILDDS